MASKLWKSNSLKKDIWRRISRKELIEIYEDLVPIEKSKIESVLENSKPWEVFSFLKHENDPTFSRNWNQ